MKQDQKRQSHVSKPYVAHFFHCVVERNLEIHRAFFDIFDFGERPSRISLINMVIFKIQVLFIQDAVFLEHHQ